ncbi:MAG: LysR family transcriptional regulator [Rhodospirillales bacterium]|nr:LysR family transcriptional regulator [Rhodospirillales bacterium]MBO6787205.1 LysR family transcriptional regulator [Rhodospirillales bacterium]
MNLKQLDAFLWVARLGSFSKTAEKLFTTQPAISSRIANLEDELQVDLFTRDGGEVRLTATGRDLLGLAEETLASVQAMKDRAGVQADVSGLLRLGAAETIVQTWLPDLLAELQATYPALEVEISVDVTSNLRNDLVEHAVDVAFLMGPVSEYTVTNTPLGHYPLVWVMRPEPGVKGPVKMTLQDMRAFPILSFPRNTRPFFEINEALRSRGTKPFRLFPSSSLSAIQRMAERGLGIASIPRVFAANALADGRLIEVECDWHPTPLHYTASYIADPSRPILARVVEMARGIAREQAA